MNYKIELTDERVTGVEPALRTRFRRRAIRRRDRENLRKVVPFYRWEVVEEDGRWLVVALQNRAVPS